MFKLITLSLGIFFIWNAHAVAQDSSCGNGYVYILTALGMACMKSCKSDTDCPKIPIKAAMVCVANVCHYNLCQKSSDCFAGQVCKTIKAFNRKAFVCFYK